MEGGSFAEIIDANQDAHDPEFRNVSRSIRNRLRAEFRNMDDNRWKFGHTNAMGKAYLLDPNPNPSGFIDNDVLAAVHVRETRESLGRTLCKVSAFE